MKNSTNNIRVELDNRYVVIDLTTGIVVDDVASDFPFSSFVAFGFVFIVLLRVRCSKK